MVYCLLDLDLVNNVSNNGGLLACFYDFGLASSLRCSRVNNRHKHDLGRFSPLKDLFQCMITFIYLIIINLKRMIIGSRELISVTSASRSTRSRRNLAFNLLLCICRVVHRYQHTIPSWRQAKWHAYNPHLDLQLAGMTTTTMHLSAPMSAPRQYTTDFLWWQCIKTWHMMRDSKLSKRMS